MADLKTGTTIGGALVWTQGNFPLYPTGDTLLYKNFLVYSENNKPQAVDNDFVSKKNGGIYLNNVTALGLGVNNSGGTGNGLSLYNGASNGEPNYGIHFSMQSNFGSHGTSGGSHATYFRHVVSYPWIFRTGSANVASINGVGFLSVKGAESTDAPSAASHLTRKDYVDGLINTTTTNANLRVLRSGDTMTGNLTVPAVYLNAEAANPNQAARLSQVVVRGTVLDYGEF